MDTLFGGIFKHKTVLVTGHTGFKGSWLVYWLKQLGANVVGYSSGTPTSPSHIDLLDSDFISVIGDIRDFEKLSVTIETYKPDIVFHLAAQSLVHFSYHNPIETYETNVMGTLKVFEACRKHNVKAIVNVTSDKAYENKEWLWGYRENDSIGGYDPYSSSKGCSELLTSSYRSSYFNEKEYKSTHNTLLASCRAGNVIGGGDWASDRLITDIMLSVSKGEKVAIRNPNATRPWQHVLEPLSGYLCVGQRLLEENLLFAGAWNFGPSHEGSITVEEVVRSVKKHWNKIDYEIMKHSKQFHEANVLKLDCSKAYTLLHWKGVWDSDTAFEKTVKWYKAYYEQNASISTAEDFSSYISDAKLMEMAWAHSG